MRIDHFAYQRATRVAVFGLALQFAMFLTLFLVPCLYVIAEGAVLRLRRLFLGQDEGSSEVGAGTLGAR